MAFSQTITGTTREMREGERDGEQHFFISLKEFKELLTKKAFLEYSMHGQHYYGTLRFSELQILAAARRV
jgi:guanylate kinase